MFDSYHQKGNGVAFTGLQFTGGLSLRATQTLTTMKLAPFFSVLKNRNLILARSGALRHNHVSYASL